MSKPIQSHIAAHQVFEYNPPKIELGVPGAALEAFERNRAEATGFKLSDVMRVHTGLNQIEADQFEEKVEMATLEKLKSVQEEAYQEAYQLGLDEGRKEALNGTRAEIDAKLGQLDLLITSLTKMKKDLYSQNERHLVELAFHMAQRLAAYELSVDPEATLSILRQSVEMSQGEEKLTVQVHPSHLDFFENLKNETGREFEFLKRCQFEPNNEFSVGGCVVVSNYGEVDSRLEERVKKLWAGLEETLPKSKAQFKVVS